MLGLTPLQRPSLAVPTPTLTLLAEGEDTSNTSSYSVNGVDTGDAASDAIIIFIGAMRRQSSPTSAMTCDMDAAAMTAIATVNDGVNTTYYLNMFAKLHTAGGTVDFDVTLDNTSSRLGYSVYKLTGAGTSLTPDDVSTEVTSGTSPISDTLTLPAGGGCALAAVMDSGTGATAADWTGGDLTEEYEVLMESGNELFTVAFANELPAGSVDVDCAVSGTLGTLGLVAAAWGKP